MPASVLPCVVRRKAALRWRLRSSRATLLYEPRTFRLRRVPTYMYMHTIYMYMYDLELQA